MLDLDPRSTALVLVDLQHGILPFAKAPYDAATILKHAAALADRARARGALVVRVRVGWHADGRDLLQQPTDHAAPVPANGLPPDWWQDPAALPAAPGDLNIVKRQWNAFHGTELDLQLRRRGIRTLVLGGIVTPFGVEGTARAAWERGYELVLPEDLSSAALEVQHTHSMAHVLPRLGRVRSTADVLQALA